MIVLSLPCLPWMKLHCCGLMIYGMMFFSREVIILVMILKLTLQREIGRNSVSEVGLSTLGIRIMCVWLISPNLCGSFQMSRISWQTLVPIRLHWDWKKCACSPSGPGALRAPIMKAAFLISIGFSSSWILSFISHGRKICTPLLRIFCF